MASCLTPTDFDELESGRLDEAGRSRLRQHLNVCEDCRRAHDEFRRAGVQIAKALRMADNRTGTFTPSGGDAGLRALDERHLPRVEGYRILGVLGQGGMGIVYRAEQARLNRTVALKVLPAVVGTANPQAVARFRREATAAARLHHTNIIPIYDFGESHHAYYYAMELIDGQPLNHVIAAFASQDATTATAARFFELLSKIVPNFAPAAPAADADAAIAPPSDHSRLPSASTSGRGRVYFRQIAHWVADAAEALAYAHGEGIIHRDIKPANFILSTDGRIMIADFGLALVVGEDSMTVTGSLMGTLRYMSPEQAMGKRMGIDHRTDIWSLGAVMYELLTFQAPFTGLDQKEVLSNIMTHEPVPPLRINPAVPRDLEVICLKALEKSQTARFPTARAMAEELRRFLNDLPIATKPTGIFGRVMRFARRRKGAVFGVGAGILLSLVVVAGFAIARHVRLAEYRRLEQVREAQRAAISDRFKGLYDRKDWAGAERLLREHVATDADDFNSLFTLALVLKESYNAAQDQRDPSQLREADSLCVQARKINPDSARGLNIHGVILKILGENSRAIEAYSRAEQLEPTNYRPCTNLGALFALGRAWDLAEQNLTKASKLAPAAAESALVWRNLAVVQAFRGREGAAKSIENALKYDKEYSSCAPVLARIAMSGGGGVSLPTSLIDDLKYFDRRTQGSDPLIKRMLALTHLHDNARDAIGYAEAALSAGDMPCINHLIVAVGRARLGQKQAAHEALKSADESWPSELREKDGVAVTADRGLLWIETAEELNRLRDEAVALLDGTSP